MFIALFLHDVEPGADIAQTLVFGREYLAVMLWGLFPFAVANAFSGTLRETGDTLMPMIAGMCAVAVNCTFNWFLIFGKCGFPTERHKSNIEKIYRMPFSSLLP